jgi:hypothetical protein
VQAITPEPGDGCSELREWHPGFIFWRGKHTGRFWCMPPGGGVLIDAESAQALHDAIDAEATT